MLKFLLIRFWPALVPVILYLFYKFIANNKVRQSGGKIIDVTPEEEASNARNRKLFYWMLITSLLIVIACLVFTGYMAGTQGGHHFIPAEYKDGVITPAKVE